LFTNCGEDSDDPLADVAIGDTYQGGIIFYILEEGDNGYIEGEVHGLIAAKEDQITTAGAEWGTAGSAEWGCYETEVSGADGTAIGTGAENTLDILAGCSEDGIAAKLCADYKITIDGATYDDWFLPSKDELNLLYLKREVVGGFADFSYYSSSQDNHISAWYHNFIDGIQGKVLKNIKRRVRAVRAF
tara:strand:- start:892 stop:1455 length:564 start_codon:yes stop_codon:yes gene_type:complete